MCIVWFINKVIVLNSLRSYYFMKDKYNSDEQKNLKVVSVGLKLVTTASLRQQYFPRIEIIGRDRKSQAATQIAIIV